MQFNCVQLFATLWTGADQAPLSIRVSRQGYWRGLPFPSPGGLPDPEIKPVFRVFSIGRLFLHHGASWTSVFASKGPQTPLPFDLTNPAVWYRDSKGSITYMLPADSLGLTREENVHFPSPLSALWRALSQAKPLRQLKVKESQ